MPRLLAAILMLSVLSGGNPVPAAPGAAGQRFEKYVNKYPSELLRAEPDVKRRMQTLLGTNYGFFMERLQTEGQFENMKGILTARTCKAHWCDSELAFIFINLSDGKIHCAIRSESYRTSNKIKTFSEDPAHFPSAALTQALDQ